MAVSGIKARPYEISLALFFLLLLVQIAGDQLLVAPLCDRRTIGLSKFFIRQKNFAHLPGYVEAFHQRIVYTVDPLTEGAA